MFTAITKKVLIFLLFSPAPLWAEDRGSHITLEADQNWVGKPEPTPSPSPDGSMTRDQVLEWWWRQERKEDLKYLEMSRKAKKKPTPSPAKFPNCKDGDVITADFKCVSEGEYHRLEMESAHEWTGGDWYVVGGTRTLKFSSYSNNERIVRPVQVCAVCGAVRVEIKKK